METVSGASNWNLMIRRESRGIAILRAGTPDRRAALPERLFGLPVTSLEDRALTPERQTELPGAEAVRITCGPAGEEAWDNRGLQDLTLPETLTGLGDYALLNCSALKTLRIHDGITRFGGGALMNCRSLDTLHLTRRGPDQGEALAWFSGELSRELDVTIYGPEGNPFARLLFPEYTELYEENCPAHHFDYFISGAGYPYHHCFRQKRLSLKDYDALWRDFLAMEHEETAALRMAWRRLRHPGELGDSAAADYRSYLKAHAGEALRLLLEEDSEALPLLLKLAEPDREALSATCALARERGATAALAVLLEERRRRFPAGLEKSFTL
ncbi:leucine-rich repeat protein [Oscillospiraceae bacterium 38-13]